ncbi:hypothetical protein NESM_000315400 [Novymonas esmeraldas]|uniref:Uncharacterized protein n=1 Tax=Novymonas esmeraldas TaxID=1808958 RepID=A0AAW0EMB1_9TRYP
MQTTLLDFMEASRRAAAPLPIANASGPAEGTSKRRRDAEYTESYPVRSRASKALAAQLRHLGPRLCARFLPHRSHRQHLRQWSAFAAGAASSIANVAPSLHAARRGPDGEPLVSAVDTFRNCVVGTAWDPSDEFLLSTRRSGFQLFSASGWLSATGPPSDSANPLLELKSATVQQRLRCENRMSFGLALAQFLGSTLNVLSAYSGASHLDVFDLEDLDEESGEPVRSYNLRALGFSDASERVCSAPSASGATTLTDSVAIVALSNGCTALIDTRTAKPTLCTESPPPPAIWSASGVGARRVAHGMGLTSVAVVDRSDGLQVLSGTKNGTVALWDLRNPSEPVASKCVGGAVEALHTTVSSASSRCGVPAVWLNTDAGEIVCLSIGASSFGELARMCTADTRRSQLSANIPSPKLAVMPLFDRLAYPHVSSNRILIFDIDIDSGMQSLRDGAIDSHMLRDGSVRPKITHPAVFGDFTDAGALLGAHDNNSELSMRFSGSATPMVAPPLVSSRLFSENAFQICSISACNKHAALCVGGDDADLHLLFDSVP